MTYYRRVGDVPDKRHTQFRRPDGGLYAEELMGQEGFGSESALLYHRHLPTAIVDARAWPEADQPLRPNHPLLPRHVRAHKVDAGPDADAVTGRHLLFGNADVRLSYVAATASSPLPAT